MSESQAALYIRLSKEDENSEISASIVNQEALLREFADKHKIKVYDIYIDDGWSGTTFERPAFKRMTEDIEAGRVNMVITKDLSRLGRDYIMTGYYMEKYFPEKRVRYISLLDGVDTGVESSANDITPFKAVMNDMYAKDISKKIKSVKRDKQKKGKYIGWKPVFGYKHHPEDKNRIIIDAEAAVIVKRMFCMAAEGRSCHSIAEQFNKENVITPSEYKGIKISGRGHNTGLWSSSRIGEMLRNEMYTGNMVQGKMVKLSYKSSKCIKQPKEKWIIVENTHEPIIDKETFYKVQKMLESRKCTRERKYDYILKGLIYCHECGCPLGVINRKNAAGQDVLYFVCRTYQRFSGMDMCTSHGIKEEKVTEEVTAKIKEIFEKNADYGKFISAAEEKLNNYTQNNKFENEKQFIQRRKKMIAEKIDRLYMDKLDSIVLAEDFERIYTKLKSEESSLTEKLSLLKSINTQTDKYAENPEQLVKNFAETVIKNRDMIISLIERIELTKDRELIIRFRCTE
ncbi:MAG: recombinase family protein [Oscillospiraceae bacterium]|nr:recombinase family protein [Oscillospiraceae bacterium]